MAAYSASDTCVCCGEYVPEGRQVCPACEAGATMRKGDATDGKHHHQVRGPKAKEAFVARSFGANTQSKEQREHVECIAARTKQAHDELKRMEERKK